MRTSLALLIAATLVSATASAANDWTGWYAGAHAGNGSGESSADLALSGQWSIEDASLQNFVTDQWSTNLDGSGMVYGFQAGYNHRISNGLVFGIELDFSELDIDESRLTAQIAWPDDTALTYSFGNSIEAKTMYSIRPRVGYAFDSSLLFLTVGWASVDIDASAEVLSNGGYSKLGTASETLNGVQWGIGYELAFAGQWSARLEYLTTDFDDFDYQTAYRPGSSFVTPAYIETVSQDVDVDVIRLGVNYQF